MHNMAKTQEMIYEKAAVTFAQRGVKNVTMSDIAAECNISTRTLYQQFRSKEELVFTMVESQLSKNQKLIDAASKVLPDAVTEISNFFKYIYRSLELMTPVFLDGIKRYYPETFKLLADFRTNSLLPYLERNMSRGINEHLYRNDINGDVACNWYCWQLQNLFLDSSITRVERHELLSNTNKFFANCIVNGEGLQLLQLQQAVA